MSNDDAPSAAAAVAAAVARRKLADEQSAYYQSLTRRGEELADAMRAVHFHSPDTLPEHAHLCAMPAGELADHVERWVVKLLDAGGRIAAEQLCDSLKGDGGTHNPFLSLALAIYRAATEGDRKRVARQLGDVCEPLLNRDNGREWSQFKDAFGAVAERVCVAWNVRRDGLMREHCPDIPRPYIAIKQSEAADATRDELPDETPPPIVTRETEEGKPSADAEPARQYVTLDQMAALVNRSKKTLERAMNATNADMPTPDVEGGGGKPHEWRWDRIRPWLESKYNRKLPNQFPTVT